MPSQGQPFAEIDWSDSAESSTLTVGYRAAGASQLATLKFPLAPILVELARILELENTLTPDGTVCLQSDALPEPVLLALAGHNGPLPQCAIDDLLKSMLARVQCGAEASDRRELAALAEKFDRAASDVRSALTHLTAEGQNDRDERSS